MIEKESEGWSKGDNSLHQYFDRTEKCSRTDALMPEYEQGGTTRTARLPWAGNLLCGAGEDLNDLPGRASCYFLQSTSRFQFKQQIRCQVTVGVFVSQFHDRDISFLSIIKLTDLTVTACDWIIKTIKPIRNEHP